jgi:hypothetical protein
MRGIIIFDIERTTGDRRIGRTLDPEGLPSGTHIIGFARAMALEELAKPAVYKVRVFLDTGDRYRRLFSVGPYPVAAMRER